MIKQASVSDLDILCSFDHVAQTEPSRREFISRAISDGACWVLERNDAIVAYGVLEYWFYQNGIVSMLYVHPDYRGQGLGRQLMHYLESISRTPKLFTSTNQSNRPMQCLLESLNYKRSGEILNLDEGDPELVYVKRLNG